MPTLLAELSAPNAEAARAFYGAVLGCRSQERTLSEHRPGFACVRDGFELATIVQAPQIDVAEDNPARWTAADPSAAGLPRFTVLDLDAAVRAATALGAEVLSGHDGESTLRDPQGATFTLVA